MSGESSGEASGEPSGKIKAEFLEAIYAQARAEFPNECCGYILGTGASAELVQCKNRQDQLHAMDPEAHPRTAANAYNIGGKELLTLVRSFESDKPATVIYHSHPRVGAYFSEEDTRAAIAAGFEVEYLVVDTQEDRVGGAVLFRREGETYVEVAAFGDPHRGATT